MGAGDEDLPCFIAIGPRSSKILHKIISTLPDSNAVLPSIMFSRPYYDNACDVIGGVATASRLVEHCASGLVVLVVDGFSLQQVRLARLISERTSALARLIIFVLPPYPYEKRLEGKFWFNAGMLASLDSGKNSMVVSIKLAEDLLESSQGEFEEHVDSMLAGSVLDAAFKANVPPMSDLLSGGSYMLLIGSIEGSRLALISHMLNAESSGIAVVRTASAGELISAANASLLFSDAGLDFLNGVAEYLIVRSESLAERDPISAVLGSRVLDSSPTLPARIEVLSRLPEL